jgi:hypothetical protein
VFPGVERGIVAASINYAFETSINYAFETPRRRGEPQIALDPLNPQAADAEGLCNLFARMIREDSELRERMKRHYAMKEVVDDPAQLGEDLEELKDNIAAIDEDLVGFQTTTNLRRFLRADREARKREQRPALIRRDRSEPRCARAARAAPSSPCPSRWPARCRARGAAAGHRARDSR